jgi:hypothetical protein
MTLHGSDSGTALDLMEEEDRKVMANQRSKMNKAQLDRALTR